MTKYSRVINQTTERGVDGVVEPYLFEPEFSDKELRKIELHLAAVALATEAAAAGPQPQPLPG